MEPPKAFDTKGKPPSDSEIDCEPVEKKMRLDGTDQKNLEEIPNSDSSSALSLVPNNGVRGLINLGGTCYMNSVVQALMHTPLLRQYFLSDNHKCMEEHKKRCQMCVLSEIFKEYHSSNTLPPMSLSRLLFLVWSEAPYLAGGAQQDAHEFYIKYIQFLHNCCSQTYDEWVKTVNPSAKSKICFCLIDQIYGGLLQSNLKCLKCGNVSLKEETFYDISLEMDKVEKEDLHNCLENYTKCEGLGKSSNIFCMNCGSKQEFSKQLRLVAMPKVLNINFKRFTQKGSQHKKLKKHVVFPFELDMSPFVSEESGDDAEEHYSLSAVIIHEGHMDSGHYVAYVKHSENIWLLCNDHRIQAVTPETVLESEAYILVYQRKSENCGQSPTD